MKGHALKISSAAIALIKNTRGFLWRNIVMKTVYGLLAMAMLFARANVFSVLSRRYRLNIYFTMIFSCAKRCCGKNLNAR